MIDTDRSIRSIDVGTTDAFLVEHLTRRALLIGYFYDVKNRCFSGSRPRLYRGLR